jgi:hypothetical protein
MSRCRPAYGRSSATRQRLYIPVRRIRDSARGTKTQDSLVRSWYEGSVTEKEIRSVSPVPPVFALGMNASVTVWIVEENPGVDVGGKKESVVSRFSRPPVLILVCMQRDRKKEILVSRFSRFSCLILVGMQRDSE